MKRMKFVVAGSVVLAGVVAGSFAVAQDGHKGDAAHGEMQLPPGWTEADMQACMIAGTPGEMQQHLTEGVGTWTGETKMWMVPDSEPIHTTTTSTVTELYDGRYIKCEIEGEIPGMGPFHGMGLYGYDNSAEQFQATWIDNHSTMIMYGTGELSSDGKTMNWTYTYHCPINKRSTTMREVQRSTGPNAMVMEMYGRDPKTGKEFKMMEIDFKRTSGAAAAASSH